LFHNDRFRAALLGKFGATPSSTDATSSHARLQRSLDRLADAFEAHVDFDRLMNIVLDSPSQKGSRDAG
jgi:cobyric acid synthase